MRQPDRIKVGAGVILVSEDGLARDWGVSDLGMRKLLDSFGMPRIKPQGAAGGSKKRYVSLYALEHELFVAGLPEALKGERDMLTEAHHELAGLLYGTITKEVIRERVRALARTFSTMQKLPKRAKTSPRRVK